MRVRKREAVERDASYKRCPHLMHSCSVLDFVGCASVPDVWLVGYGLDDQQEKRGWVHLFACPKCAGVPKTEDDEVLFSDVEALAAERKRLLAQLTS